MSERPLPEVADRSNGGQPRTATAQNSSYEWSKIQMAKHPPKFDAPWWPATLSHVWIPLKTEGEDKSLSYFALLDNYNSTIQHAWNMLKW